MSQHLPTAIEHFKVQEESEITPSSSALTYQLFFIENSSHFFRRRFYWTISALSTSSVMEVIESDEHTQKATFSYFASKMTSDAVSGQSKWMTSITFRGVPNLTSQYF